MKEAKEASMTLCDIWAVCSVGEGGRRSDELRASSAYHLLSNKAHFDLVCIIGHVQGQAHSLYGPKYDMVAGFALRPGQRLLKAHFLVRYGPVMRHCIHAGWWIRSSMVVLLTLDRRFMCLCSQLSDNLPRSGLNKFNHAFMYADGIVRCLLSLGLRAPEGKQ